MTDNKTLLLETAARLKELRQSLRYTPEKMAAHLEISYSAYLKYEYGNTFPRPYTLARIAESFDVSLDWLISGRGPMLYENKARPGEKAGFGPDRDNEKELFDYMERFPVLRYEMLRHFLTFKVKNKELLEPSKEKGE